MSATNFLSALISQGTKAAAGYTSGRRARQERDEDQERDRERQRYNLMVASLQNQPNWQREGYTSAQERDDALVRRSDKIAEGRQQAKVNNPTPPRTMTPRQEQTAENERIRNDVGAALTDLRRGNPGLGRDALVQADAQGVVQNTFTAYPWVSGDKSGLLEGDASVKVVRYRTGGGPGGAASTLATCGFTVIG